MALGSAFGYAMRASPRDWNAVVSAFGGPLVTNLVSKSYSNQLSRDYSNYQKRGYERQLADWHKNVPNRSIKYPELSYEGHIRGLANSISQTYASDARNIADFERSVGYAVAGGFHTPRTNARTLYGRSTGRTSRYL